MPELTEHSTTREQLAWWEARLAHLQTAPYVTTSPIARLSRANCILDAWNMVRTLRASLYPNACTEPNARNT